jgi:hypothetical protein
MTAKAKGNEKPIRIPELEEAMKTFKPRNVAWTEREDLILKTYAFKVPWELLKKQLPNRTVEAMKEHFKRLRLEGE